MTTVSEQNGPTSNGSPLMVLGDVQPLPCQSITEMFKGKSVLVTGATGFLGKVLVEKLLRSCPGIVELFLLIRPSRHGDAEQRLEDYRKNIIFNRLREEQPDALNKLRVLAGDITAEHAGLAGWQLRKVITDVNFVFHCAANVRFDDDAKDILSINLLGVQNIFQLCKKCEQLQALVHVSTAYSFCHQRIISEQIYPELVKPENIIESTKWMTEEQLDLVCQHYMQRRPALYHFSKALAETFLVDSSHNLPVIIVRPSIVTAAMKEPYPGWIDNYNGPSGFINLCGKGVIKTLLVEPGVNADWVPVDIVVNTLIVAAHYIAVRRKVTTPFTKLASRNNVPIINCTCPNKNVITWMKVVDICVPLLRKYPSGDVIGMPGGTVTSSPFLYYACRLFYHYIPALFLDGVNCLTLHRPGVIGLYDRIHRVMSYLEYYTTRSFEFRSQNMRKLVEQMELEERKVFPIDQSVLNWRLYMENYVLGVRRYFNKEKDDTLPQSRKQMMRTYYLWMIFRLASIAGVVALARSLHHRRFFQWYLFPSFPFFSYAVRRLAGRNAN